jgi:UDP-3-O-[3-hydroxymyristoyl] glucosamine N-acyltransferase
VLYHEVTLGDRVVIHSASVIGADGFGFAFDGERSVKIAQLGGVRIGNDVEIGAASTIDRGALLDTIIGEGVKIDNHVQIGHNCVIGKHTIICGCAALAGSVTVGEYCIFGGGSGAVGHITVADRVQVSAMALLSKSVTEAGMVSSGTLASPTPEWKRNALRFQQLDNIAKRLKELERKGD